MNRLLAIAGTAESGSEHPLGIAIRKHCQSHFGCEQFGRCEDFNAVWGYGLSAKVHGVENIINRNRQSGDFDKTYSVLIGNREWMKRNSIDVANEVDSAMAKHEHDGHTAVIVAIDGRKQTKNKW